MYSRVWIFPFVALNICGIACAHPQGHVARTAYEPHQVAPESEPGLISLFSAPPARPRAADAFAPFAPKVTTHWDGQYLFVESDGMPDHALMVGIMAWQQQVPLSQPYTGANAWRIPLVPVVATDPLSARTHFLRGAIALAANGVPIFNALNNRGVDSNLAGELDEFGGHAGRGDDYHYHIAPVHLEKLVGKGKPIGYALDGYPLYGLTEPDGSPPKKLDAFNGHDDPKGGYHYHATRTYPYVNGGFHGEVTEIDGQVDPQPRAEGVRPDTSPLPGATVSGFTRVGKDSYSLAYTLGGREGRVDYRKESDGSYTFTYRISTGATIIRSYPQRGGQGRRQEAAGPEAAPGRPTDFQLFSPVVASGGSLPIAFTCDGKGVSPPVAWKNVPAGTKSLVLIMHHFPPGDEEAPHVYWLAYNIPPGVREIPPNDQAIGLRGGNTVNSRLEYAPPCSKGPGKKWYVLTLYALSEEPKIGVTERGVTRDAMLKAMEGKILASSVLNVSYERTGRGDSRSDPVSG